jgi:hypothetical protein
MFVKQKYLHGTGAAPIPCSAVEKLKKSIANSAGSAEKQMFGHGKGHDNDDEEEEDDYDVSNFVTQPFIPLCMFVLRGEERVR